MKCLPSAGRSVCGPYPRAPANSLIPSMHSVAIESRSFSLEPTAVALSRLAFGERSRCSRHAAIHTLCLSTASLCRCVEQRGRPAGRDGQGWQQQCSWHVSHLTPRCSQSTCVLACLLCSCAGRAADGCHAAAAGRQPSHGPAGPRQTAGAAVEGKVSSRLLSVSLPGCVKHAPAHCP